MSHLIELPDDVYNALEEAAANCGTTPAKWLAQALKQSAALSAEPAQARDYHQGNGVCALDFDDVFWRESTTPR
jgi:predicted transcriptional regulator